MIKYLLIIFLFFFTEKNYSQNKYPIVLVHGFMGWGPDEMGSYNYWGGTYDLVDSLKSDGYEIYVSNVGPISSNWDRAIELYYQIKGGQVDYGLTHSNKFGLVQKPKGKKYKGLYPKWSEKNPIHLIGHSMGGQTSRMLEYLLKTSFVDSTGSKEKSILLKNRNNKWIKSITSISTPHNGTTLSDIVSSGIPFLQDFISVAAVVGNSFYDFDLEQWNFRLKVGESWNSYFKRLQKHPAWGTKNIVSWDVSIEGAKELNTLSAASINTYYFSFSNSNTRLDSSTGRHIPNNTMSYIIRANARLMGMKKAYYADGTPTDSTWFSNDGIVNKVSMSGPTTGLNGPDPVTQYREDELLIPGQWYKMKEFQSDHKRLIGHGASKKEKEALRALFLNHIKLLQSLRL